MYCTNCGNKIEEQEKFCTNCGNKISNEKNEIKENKENLVGNKISNNYNFMSFLGILILFVAIVVGIQSYLHNQNEKDAIKRDKIQMLSTIQKYSVDTITVDDFTAEKVEEENTYTIYRINVNKSNYLITGYFYVALVKPNGIIADYTLLNENLSELKEAMNRY